VWIGGRSGAAIRRVGEYGDGWTIFWDRPEQVRETRERIARAWADYDRAGEPGIAVTRPTQVAADPDRDPDRPLVGDAETVAADVRAYADAGTTRLVLDFYTRDPAEQATQIERWGERVLPLL
jgi:alkanesulfonate monooxygenase SsuD/methylene tetrahydromethanopterin reductase-like flavin-dependent oxidoreductase (luciferase family)